MASADNSENRRTGSGDRGRPCDDTMPTETMLSPDLQDWLKLTNWHNAEYREKKLAHYRHIDIKDQKEGVKLRAGTVENDLEGPQSAKRLNPEDVQAHPTSLSMALFGDYAAPRAPRGRSASPPRIGFSRHNPHRSRDSLPLYHGDTDQVGTPDQSPSRHRTGYHQRGRVDRAEYGNRPGREYGDRPNRDRVDDVRNVGRELASLRAPKQITLGDPGEVRFFVMRSYSWHHVYDSMDDGVWATQSEQADILTKAFSSGMTVVLFFAVNKSQGFQGYAVMKSAPSKDTRRPGWWYHVRWDISEPFKVEWKNTIHVSNTYVSHISNRFNLDLPVTRARNCQEIDDSAGRQMISILESRAMDYYKRAKRTGTLI
ncbi:YTH-domain-containing protein [Hypoxylon sp. FL0890]|nr:YTH-domain-containing protein [Hypoxylon sp. FL0890]